MTSRSRCEQPWVTRAAIALVILATLVAGCQRRKPLQFSVTVPQARRTTPVDGRLLVILSKDPSREPRLQVTNNTLATQQIFGVDVDGLPSGRPAVLDATAVGFPLGSLGQLSAGEYTVQAMINVYDTFHRKDGHTVKLPMDRWEGQHWNIKPGNLYSEPRKMRIDPHGSGTIEISLDKEVPPLPYPKDTKYIKYVRIESKLLSDFWGRKMELGAFVLLPEGFDEHQNARYPLIVSQGHFQTFFEGSSGQTPTKFSETPPDAKLNGDERLVAEYSYKFYQDWVGGKLPRMITMTIQHANPYYDDSYSVNSANIGPYGDAITQELIPYVEQKFRAIGQPWSRVLCGCSTGGWEALGAQVFYPDFFNGTWANAPSPIDLRAYRLVNIYNDSNAYWYDAPWSRLPRPSIGFRAPREVLPADRAEDFHMSTTMEQDNQLELVIGTKGRGAGLWDAMQAVFSPVGSDGYPKPIWDKRTGVIDHDVAEHWRDHYDLGYVLRRDWTTLGPKLAGKLHLKVGTMDQFYLSNAVRYVGAFLESTKNPYYAGSVEYGDRFVHCYTGDPTSPLSIARMTSNQRDMPQMAAHILKTAPKGADVTSWKY
jgi:Putative esterase